MGSDGRFYRNKNACDASEVDAVAMVVFYDPDKFIVADEGTQACGLAIALEEFNSLPYFWAEGDHAKNHCTTGTDSHADYPRILDGLAQTARLANEGRHAAAESAYHYIVLQNLGGGFSNWFLPSSGQWILAQQANGFQWAKGDEYLDDEPYSFQGEDKWPWEASNVTYAKLKSEAYYWTVTERSDDPSKVLIFSGGRGVFPAAQKDEKHMIRPFIAFGTEGTAEMY